MYCPPGVSFTLTVTKGDDEQELSFSTSEVTFGRTQDNDVVVKDPDASRSHCRIYVQRGQHFVEDLKSANGTELNGKPLRKATALKNGDRISIGEVHIDFRLAGPSQTAPDSEDVAPRNNPKETNPGASIDNESDDRLQAPSATMAEVEDDEDDPDQPPDESTEATRAPEPEPMARPSRPSALVKRPTSSVPPRRVSGGAAKQGYDGEDDSNADSTKHYDVPPPKALARKQQSLPPRPVRQEEDIEPAAAEPEMTAAEKARQRRELQRSSSGRAQLLWSQLSLPAKIAVGTLGALFTVGLFAGAVFAAMPKKVEHKVEPVELVPNGDGILDTFGLGDGVTFVRPDMKGFTFSYPSPTPIVGVLHFQAKDCAKDEVMVELNGNNLGPVLPDTVESSQRQLEVVLPASQLKVDEPNEVVFDNVNNPPAEDAWRVWNVWVEVIPVPQMSAEEASRRAKDDIDRASHFYEMRDVGAMNLFKAWKQYRDAWLLLESTPDRPEDLLQISRTRMREIRPELDRKCSAMLLDFQKFMSRRDPDLLAARRVLMNVPEHFQKEHPCVGLSRYMLHELEDEVEEVE